MLFPLICNERVSIYTSTRKHNFNLLGGSIRFRVEFGDEVTITALKPFTFTYLGRTCSVRSYKSIKLQYGQSISLDNHISIMEVRVLPPLPKYTPNDSPWEWKNLNRYLSRLPENLRRPVGLTAIQWKRKQCGANLQKWLLAFCMASHPRLGEHSAWKNLPQEVGEMILHLL
jgi:hypothetical protein